MVPGLLGGVEPGLAANGFSPRIIGMMNAQIQPQAVSIPEGAVQSYHRCGERMVPFLPSGTIATVVEGGPSRPPRASNWCPAQQFLLNLGSAMTMERQPVERLGDGHQRKLPIMRAVSMGRCNTSLEFTSGSFKA
jgi:hypothetical protein